MEKRVRRIVLSEDDEEEGTGNEADRDEDVAEPTTSTRSGNYVTFVQL